MSAAYSPSTRPARSRQTSAVMLASRRPAAPSWLPVRKNGFPERMSAGSGNPAEVPPTGVGMRPLPRCDVFTATGSVWQASESEVRRLALAAGREEAGLPAREPRLVPEQEPEHHRDARVAPGDLVRLRQVTRLLDPAHAEERVGRLRLVAVLGDPELLRPVQPAEELRQHADVSQRDRVRPRLRRRRLRRLPVVRVVRPHVEVAEAVMLDLAEEACR